VTDYDLNPEIGELYPVLLDAKGNLIDGFHRRKANKNWHTIKLAQIKTKADLLTARIIANCQRLDHSEEAGQWVNELASELEKEHSDLAMSRRIADRTGMRQDWVLARLDEKFKNPKISAARRVTTERKASEHSSRPTGGISNDEFQGMPVEPPRVIRDDAKGDWVLKQWNWVLEKVPETNAVNDLLPQQRKQVLKQLKALNVRITAWIEAVSDEEV